jgi:hypothetical protein
MHDVSAKSPTGLPDRDDAELARAATENRAAFAAIHDPSSRPSGGLHALKEA